MLTGSISLRILRAALPFSIPWSLPIPMGSSMCKTCRRLCWGCFALLVVVGIAGAGWLSLTYQPGYYRAMVDLPRSQRDENAKQFVASSLQLSNDIRNEPLWEAVFSDQEVNAWLAQDLLTHFAEHLPPEVRQPRVVFETDRIVLAFQYRQSGIETVITVMARPRVSQDNTVELTIETVRAGILPVYADGVLDRITGHARARGIDVTWSRREGYPVVRLYYSPNLQREDVRLETVQLRGGQMRLAGRSDRSKGEIGTPKLPTRKVLQSKFPSSNRNHHPSTSL